MLLYLSIGLLPLEPHYERLIVLVSLQVLNYSKYRTTAGPVISIRIQTTTAALASICRAVYEN